MSERQELDSVTSRSRLNGLREWNEGRTGYFPYCNGRGSGHINHRWDEINKDEVKAFAIKQRLGSTVQEREVCKYCNMRRQRTITITPMKKGVPEVRFKHDRWQIMLGKVYYKYDDQGHQLTGAEFRYD